MPLIKSNESIEYSTRDSDLVRKARKANRTGPIRKPESLRILIVDDSADSADSIATLLRMLGYAVRAVYSGQSALEAAAEFEPNLVLLDIEMPVMDGHEVARRFRQHAQLKTARLIAISGFGRESDRQKSHDAGFDHHLVKPFMPEELLQLIAGFS
jgi:CheY-like chemotaxis protein